MAQPMMQSLEAPKPEHEGLTPQEIHWIPLVVPFCAVLLALVGLAVMSVA